MKRIVLCADGTWNEPERKDEATGHPQPTNVLKVARAIQPRAAGGVEQVVYYHEGVGTAGWLDTYTGGAFGSGMCHNVRALYRFLVYNYEPGDELFFFGFSRGAFTVRTLAGFMHAVGLVRKEDEFYTPQLFDVYQSSAAPGSEAWRKAFHHIDHRRPCPPILFIGVWDTVGALGAPGVMGQLLNRNKYKFHDIDLSDDIAHAYHALAIDERRKPFAPSLWTRPSGWKGTLEQVWFAGVHSNVGGSHHPDGLANEALHWMVEKAEFHGLDFDSQFLAHYRPCFNSTLHSSMTPFYRVLGEHVRVVGDHVSDGEAVHQSVIDRMALPSCRYDPPNVRKYLASPRARVVDTARLSRGTAC